MTPCCLALPWFLPLDLHSAAHSSQAVWVAWGSAKCSPRASCISQALPCSLFELPPGSVKTAVVSLPPSLPWAGVLEQGASPGRLDCPVAGREGVIKAGERQGLGAAPERALLGVWKRTGEREGAMLVRTAPQSIA